MNGSDRICHEKFCDSFFYATENIFEKWIVGKYRQSVVYAQGMIPVQMDEGYKEGNYAILIRRKKHEL